MGRLWHELGEVVDDAADLRDRMRDRRTPKLARNIAEAYVERRCSLHAHVRLRPGGIEEVARDLCIAFQWLPQSYQEVDCGGRRHERVGVPVDQRQRLEKRRSESHANVEGAVLVYSVNLMKHREDP